MTVNGHAVQFAKQPNHHDVGTQARGLKWVPYMRGFLAEGSKQLHSTRVLGEVTAIDYHSEQPMPLPVSKLPHHFDRRRPLVVVIYSVAAARAFDAVIATVIKLIFQLSTKSTFCTKSVEIQ